MALASSCFSRYRFAPSRRKKLEVTLIFCNSCSVGLSRDNPSHSTALLDPRQQTTGKRRRCAATSSFYSRSIPRRLATRIYEGTRQQHATEFLTSQRERVREVTSHSQDFGPNCSLATLSNLLPCCQQDIIPPFAYVPVQLLSSMVLPPSPFRQVS